MAKKTTIKNKVKKTEDDVNIVPVTKKPLEAESEPQKSIVKVRCMTPFWDLQGNCQRNAGAEFECTEDRAKTLENLHLVIVL